MLSALLIVPIASVLIVLLIMPIASVFSALLIMPIGGSNLELEGLNLFDDSCPKFCTFWCSRQDMSCILTF